MKSFFLHLQLLNFVAAMVRCPIPSFAGVRQSWPLSDPWIAVVALKLSRFNGNLLIAHYSYCGMGAACLGGQLSSIILGVISRGSVQSSFVFPSIL